MDGKTLPSSKKQNINKKKKNQNLGGKSRSGNADGKNKTNGVVCFNLLFGSG